MISINKISKLGIGTYRMTISNKEHFSSLQHSIDNGVNLIDTSSNYQFGNSERLIGEIISKNDRKQLFIISKAGYIEGDDVKEFADLLNLETTTKIDDGFYYSFEKSFLKKQIQASLNRMKTDYLDGFLIHNPEYHLTNPKFNDLNFLRQLQDSFMFLEQLVKDGVIRYYGLSSNKLPSGEINIEKILENKKMFPNFKLLQFPYNLIENEATQNKKDKDSLIEYCKKNHIKTLANRPLNTTYQGKVLRLANYSSDYATVDFSIEEELFNEFLKLISRRLIEIGETSKPNDFSPINFLIRNRKSIANPEAVMQATNSHILPFIQQLDFKDDKALTLLKELKNYWLLYSKMDSTNRASILKDKLQSCKVLKQNDDRDISLIACEKYLEDGLDTILVGMRKKQYFEKLKTLL